MKKEELFRLLGDVDEQKVADAVRTTRAAKKAPWLQWGAVAACFCLCVIGAFKFWNPGMGCAQQVRDFFAADGNLYFSTWEEGVYCWNPDMTEPQKLSGTGRISKTDSGLILYSIEENTLWEVTGSRLTEIGKADMGDALEDAFLIGIYDGYAYWGGARKDLPADTCGSRILKTPLSGGQAEEVVSISDGLYLRYHMRGNFLYYHLEEFDQPEEKICARNLATGEEVVLKKLPKEDTRGLPRVYFMDNDILVRDQEKNSLYRMEYTGGELMQLTDSLPITGAVSEWNGAIYFETAFGENESEEFLSGNGYYSENLVSVDLTTGELMKMEGFPLESGQGTVRYILTDLAMTEGGFYFLDPNAGVRYHNDADGTDTEVYRSN